MDEYGHKSPEELRYDDYLMTTMVDNHEEDKHHHKETPSRAEEVNSGTSSTNDNNNQNEIDPHDGDMIDDGFGWYPFTLCQPRESRYQGVIPVII
jgi:hypothetical protein